MPSDTRTLSKSDFKIARDCPTKLFYKESGNYASVNDDDQYLALLAQGGYMIEQLAKARYPHGREMGDRHDPAEAWAATEQAIRSGDVTLFEATLLNGRQLARVDILERRGNTLRLVEVKAKSWDAEKARVLAEQGKPSEFRTGKAGVNIAAKWRPYLEDVTYQCLLLESLFPEFQVEPVLCLVNKTARCVTDALPEQFDIVREAGPDGRTRLVSVSFLGDARAAAREQLTIEIAVRDEVEMLRDDVRTATAMLLASYEPTLTRIASPIGTACRDCEYRVPRSSVSAGQRNGFAECWGELAAVEPSILELYQVSRLSAADALIAGGTAGLLDIPNDVVNALRDGGVIASRQALQIDHTRSNQPFVGSGLKPALERAAPGAPLRHLEWINSDRSWPNQAFARSLARAIGPSGTVLTWSPFESSILKTVRDELPERGLLDAELARVFALVDDSASGSSARVVDMHQLAAKEFFHFGMGGRTSIKVVLDALWRSDADMRAQFFALTGKRGDSETGPYAALEPLVIAGVEQEVAEGTGAIRAYEALMFGAERHDARVQGAWRQLLLEYCKLDTLAMVLIWEHWRRAVGLPSA